MGEVVGGCVGGSWLVGELVSGLVHGFVRETSVVDWLHERWITRPIVA